MTKHVHVIDSPDTDGVGNPIGAKGFGALETMVAKAKLLNPPDSAKYRLRITMGGKVKQLSVEWDD